MDSFFLLEWPMTHLMILSKYEGGRISAKPRTAPILVYFHVRGCGINMFLCSQVQKWNLLVPIATQMSTTKSQVLLYQSHLITNQVIILFSSDYENKYCINLEGCTSWLLLSVCLSSCVSSPSVCLVRCVYFVTLSGLFCRSIYFVYFFSSQCCRTSFFWLARTATLT